MTDTERFDLTRQGRDALARLDRDAAAAVFAQALEDAPDFVDGLVGLGQVAYERGDLTVAEHEFDRAVAAALKRCAGVWPKRLAFDDAYDRAALRAVHGMGVVAFRQGHAAKARTWCALEQRLDPADHQGSHFLVKKLDAGQLWNE